MAHGDLKGVCHHCLGKWFYLTNFTLLKANVLIDQNRNARLADFGLIKITSNPANILPSSSHVPAGTARWMSPELIDPSQFGLEESCPTIASDCYSLGMVIYETLSGHAPFHKDIALSVVVKVTRGEHPPREPGFADSLWHMLELCWTSQPKDRPSIIDILGCLQEDLSCPESMLIDSKE